MPEKFDFPTAFGVNGNALSTTFRQTRSSGQSNVLDSRKSNFSRDGSKLSRSGFKRPRRSSIRSSRSPRQNTVTTLRQDDPGDIDGVESDDDEEESDDDEDDDDDEESVALPKRTREMKAGIALIVMLTILVIGTAAFAIMGNNSPEPQVKAQQQDSEPTDAEGFYPWLDWSPCSVTCDKGIQKRTRRCSLADDSCEGDRTESQECDPGDCSSKTPVEETTTAKTTTAKPTTNTPDNDILLSRITKGPVVAAEVAGRKEGSTCAVVQTTTLPGILYSLVGYNFAFGNPVNGKIDPGFRSYRIFAADSSIKVYEPTCKFVIPGGFRVTIAPSCKIETDTTTVGNEHDLQTSFYSKFVTNFSMLAGVKQFTFSGSAEYLKTKQQLEKESKLTIFTMSECIYYEAQLNDIGLPHFLEAFITKIKYLADPPSGLDESEVYFQFFDEYGTHFPYKVKYGARYTRKYTVDLLNYLEKGYERIHFQNTIKFKPSPQNSLESTASLEKTVSTSLSIFNKVTEEEILSVGAPPPSSPQQAWEQTIIKDQKSCAPLYYSFRAIEELITWKNFLGVPIRNSTLEKVREKMIKFKDDYCGYLLRRKQVESCLSTEDRKIEIKAATCIPVFFINGRQVTHFSAKPYTYNIMGSAACDGQQVIYTLIEKAVCNKATRQELDKLEECEAKERAVTDRRALSVRLINLDTGKDFLYLSYQTLNFNTAHGLSIDVDNKFLFVSIKNSGIHIFEMKGDKPLRGIIAYTSAPYTDAMVTLPGNNNGTLYFGEGRALFKVVYYGNGTQSTRYQAEKIGLVNQTITGLTINMKDKLLLVQTSRCAVFTFTLDGKHEKNYFLSESSEFNCNGIVYCKGYIYFLSPSKSALHKFDLRKRVSLVANAAELVTDQDLGHQPTSFCQLSKYDKSFGFDPNDGSL